MTTICYDHETKIIAFDSRFTGDHIIEADDAKKYRIADNGDFWVLSGVVGDYESLMESFYLSELPEKQRPLDCGAFVVNSKTKEISLVSYDEQNGFWKEALSHTKAIGTGAQFCRAALDHGRTAISAIYYASTRDSLTGGIIREFQIDQWILKSYEFDGAPDFRLMDNLIITAEEI